MTWSFNNVNLGKTIFIVDGEPTSISRVVGMATKRGVTLNRSTLLTRLRAGDNTSERLFRPVDEGKAKGAKKRGKPHDPELAAAIARLGPPKRY